MGASFHLILRPPTPVNPGGPSPLVSTVMTGPTSGLEQVAAAVLGLEKTPGRVGQAAHTKTTSATKTNQSAGCCCPGMTSSSLKEIFPISPVSLTKRRHVFEVLTRGRRQPPTYNPTLSLCCLRTRLPDYPTNAKLCFPNSTVKQVEGAPVGTPELREALHKGLRLPVSHFWGREEVPDPTRGRGFLCLSLPSFSEVWFSRN